MKGEKVTRDGGNGGRGVGARSGLQCSGTDGVGRNRGEGEGGEQKGEIKGVELGGVKGMECGEIKRKGEEGN